MDGDTIDIDCVACGYAIKFNQSAGVTACGHGNIHYNCSYLNIKCDICHRPLIYDVNRSDNDCLSFDMDRLDSHQTSENTELLTTLRDIKEMLMEVKSEQAKQSKSLEELKTEFRDFKSKEMKILDLQTVVLQMKCDKIARDQQELEDRLKNMTCKN